MQLKSGSFFLIDERGFIHFFVCYRSFMRVVPNIVNMFTLFGIWSGPEIHNHPLIDLI